jgi:hypothetical protein
MQKLVVIGPPASEARGMATDPPLVIAEGTIERRRTAVGSRGECGRLPMYHTARPISATIFGQEELCDPLIADTANSKESTGHNGRREHVHNSWTGAAIHCSTDYN